MSQQTIIIQIKHLLGESKGKITRVELDPQQPNKLWECRSKSKEFVREHERAISITQLLDEGYAILLSKRDADKVKKLTGKSYEFAKKAEWEKTLAKRAKTRKANRIKAAQEKLEKLEKKRLADSTIIQTEPQGKHREYQLKTASGVTICTHRTANPEYLEDYQAEEPQNEPQNTPEPSTQAPVAKRPSKRVILPHTSEEIPVPADIQITPMLTLIRDCQGKTHRVTVTHDLQFLYEGTIYRTLTEVGKKAAQYQTSGYAFFGLPNKKRR